MTVSTNVLLVSDIHLSLDVPLRTELFLQFIDQQVGNIKSLYILGDLFEYWVGDDDINNAFHERIVLALRRVVERGVKLFVMVGNRDFLIGTQFAQASGAVLLKDPTLITIAEKKILLMHGDAQCTNDMQYKIFRTIVRNRFVQKIFLYLPLKSRQRWAQKLRQQSQKSNQMKTSEMMDVNLMTIRTMFEEFDVKTIIHGHTHRPARHVMEVNGQTCVRFVLPDWEVEEQIKRGGGVMIDEKGEVFRIDTNGQLL
jgi:UDP-2,3-diacylglucosamine hydrolase